MKITVRQLKRLIREAVEDASGEQLYDHSLGLKVVTTSREAANGTIALLDPQTEDTYKITVPSKYVRLYKPDWDIKTYRNKIHIIASPKDVANVSEFVEYARERISQYVNKRRVTLSARKKEFFQRQNALQDYRDRQIETDRRRGTKEFIKNFIILEGLKDVFAGKDLSDEDAMRDFLLRDPEFVIDNILGLSSEDKSVFSEGEIVELVSNWQQEKIDELLQKFDKLPKSLQKLLQPFI
mgnify:CR=1 FL=1